MTTAFSSLVGGGSTPFSPAKDPGSAPDKNLPAEAQERRRRMGLLLRRASKMTLNPDPTAVSGEAVPAALLKVDKKAVGVKRVFGLLPLAEDQVLQGTKGILGPLEQHFPQSLVDLQVQEGTARLEPLKEGQPLDTSSISIGGSQRKRSPGRALESFELEEVKQL